MSCITVFCALFYLTMIYYLRHDTKISQIQWDVETTTASDYTGDMAISNDQYNNFI